MCMSLFKKDPLAKLRKQYETLMGQAMQAQRGGDIVKCSELTAEADKVMAQIEAAGK